MYSEKDLYKVKDTWLKSRNDLQKNDENFFSVVKGYSEELAGFLSRETCGSYLSGYGLFEGRDNHDSFIIALQDAAHKLFFQDKIETASKLLNHVFDLKYENLLKDRTFKYVKRVNFEITSVCNLKCKYCTFESGKRKHYIDPVLFEKILQDIADCHPRLEILALYMSGESLMHPNFIELLHVVNKVKENSLDFCPEIYLHTNGTLWVPEMNDKIMATGVFDRVVWSIDGVDKASFEFMRGGGNIYDDILSNFEYFLDNRPSSVKAWVNNLREPDLLDTECADKKLESLLRRADVTAVYPPRDLNQNELTKSRFIGSAEKFCEYIFHTVVITTDGKMSLCCADYNSENAFGDLKKYSFSDVYYGSERFEIMKKMSHKKRNKMNGCKKCTLLHANWFQGAHLSRNMEDRETYQKKLHLIKKWRQIESQYDTDKVAIYGSGRHTVFLNNILLKLNHSIIGAVIDDCLGSSPCLFGRRPKTVNDIKSQSFDAVILSTNHSQKKMAERCRQIFGPNIKLINLYEGFGTEVYSLYQ